MKPIIGFPDRMKFTPLPNFFFSTLLPQIDDINELRLTLFILETLYQKHGYPSFVAFNELLANISLTSSLKSASEPPDKELRKALDMATRRGTILHMELDRDGTPEDIFLLNTRSNRQAITKIEAGDLPVPGLQVKSQPYIELAAQPDIFTLYEENIGMLTPIIADELQEAEKVYPVDWIRDAIKEAVALNKRNWRYIAAILERWVTEGRGHGTYRRDSAQKTDPDKYIKGKYGHMVQR